MNYTFMRLRGNSKKLFSVTNYKKIAYIVGILLLALFFNGNIVVCAEENSNASQSTGTDTAKDTTKDLSRYFDEKQGKTTNYYRTEPRTKKGLQEAFSYSGVYEDLGISHTLINICMNRILNGHNPYVYHGKTYYFDDVPNLSVETVREFNEKNVCVTVVLLLEKDENSLKQNLIYPGGLNKNKLYYGWNVNDANAMETMNALLDYLAFTYGQEDCHVDNWVVGNEVNMPNAWNYIGTTDIKTNADVAAKSLAMVDNAIKRYNSGARAYLSLDRSWNHSDEGRGISSKDFLDAFAERIKEISEDIDWNIAYHIYSPIMTDSNIWNARNALYYSPVSEVAAFICARNLEIFTDYVKDNFGEDVRIILSEQGFTMYGGQLPQQAAALAYTYYAAEFNDMVDATMFRSLKDDPSEMRDRFYFGLLNSDGSKRPAYEVFKYMDTEEWEKYTMGCMETIGIGVWNEVVTYFDGERFIRKPLEELKLKNSGTVIGVGYKQKTSFTIYPEFATTEELSWKSQDESIVKVDEKTGEITGVSPGRSLVNAFYKGEEMATLIVVVKEARECEELSDNFINSLYRTVTKENAPANDLQSYRERLMGHHITAAQVVYEVVSRKGKLDSLTEEEFVRLMYRAVLQYEDDEIDEEKVAMYVTCMEAGMSKWRVFVDLISTVDFDYLCYDYGVDTGSLVDISALRGLNMTSYNKNSDVTYYVALCVENMLGRKATEVELQSLCSKLLSKNVQKKDIALALYDTEEYQKRKLSNEEFFEVATEISGYKDSFGKIRRSIILGCLKQEKVTREQFLNDLLDGKF